MDEECIQALTRNPTFERSLFDSTMLKGFGLDTRAERLFTKAWKRYPKEHGLLVPLAMCALDTRSGDFIIEGLDSLNTDGDDRTVRMAQIAILLRGGRSVPQLAERIRDLLIVSPEATGVLVQSIQARELPVLNETSELLHLMTLGGSPDSKAVVIRALRLAFRRRTSNLSDLARWTSLGFPLELAKVVEISS
jgi:hypothetical protein